VVATPEADVLGDGHVREERVVLKDEAEVAVLRRHITHAPVVERNRAVVGVEAGDRLQQERLPAPAGSENNQTLSAVDVEGGVDVERLSAVGRERRRNVGV
jgi:hypothetical protein